MIKNDRWIESFGMAGGIDPFNPKHINPASYDVIMDGHWLVPISNTDDGEYDEFTGEKLVLYPGEVVLATTLEVIKMPRNVCGDLKLKSTIGRSWINHSLAGWIDPGFAGQITLELQNIGKKYYVLRKGMKIAQLIFFQMEADPEIAYGEMGRGRYQNQKGATAARLTSK